MDAKYKQVRAKYSIDSTQDSGAQMAKTLNGMALISYGTLLPPVSTAYDGALFFKTTSTGTGLNTPSVGDGPQGLYVFGFVRDNDPSTFGSQAAHAWMRSSSAGGVDADTLNGLPSSAFQPVNADLTALANTTTTGIYVRTGSGTSITRSLGAGSSKIALTNASGVSGNPTIDVVEANLTLTNLGGTLTVSKGGTGAVNLTGYLKGNGTSAFSAVTTIAATDIAAGTAGINITGSAGSATTANTANSAATLTTARNITLTGPVTGTASFNGSADISIATTLSGISGTYVAKAGDSMTGNLTMNGITLSYSTNTVTAAAFSGAGGSVGYTVVTRGDATHTGYLALFNASGVRQGYIGNAADAAGAIQYYSDVGANHQFTGAIIASGDVTAFSDLKLKTDIELISDPMNRIMQLKGVNFTRVDTGKRGTGLIAQHVQAVLPEAVTETSDGTLTVAYGNLVGLLVEGMKAQQTQIAELRADLDKLQDRCSASIIANTKLR